jgi:hypothetical protein
MRPCIIVFETRGFIIFYDFLSVCENVSEERSQLLNSDCIRKRDRRENQRDWDKQPQEVYNPETGTVSELMEIHPHQRNHTRAGKNSKEVRDSQNLRIQSRYRIQSVSRKKHKEVQQNELDDHICTCTSGNYAIDQHPTEHRGRRKEQQ